MVTIENWFVQRIQTILKPVDKNKVFKSLLTKAEATSFVFITGLLFIQE